MILKIEYPPRKQHTWGIPSDSSSSPGIRIRGIGIRVLAVVAVVAAVVVAWPIGAEFEGTAAPR